MKKCADATPHIYLGIEGGGTHTSVLVVDGGERVLQEFQSGPAVLPLMSDRELHWHLRDIASRLKHLPHAMGIGLAGVRSDAERERLRRATLHVWPQMPLTAANDLETGLEAARVLKDIAAQVLIISGTGSCCFGRASDGRVAKVGGRGHIIGDRGSACDIGLRALRGALAEFDHSGRMGLLGQMILSALLFNEPEQLIPWSIEAKKTEIASLCIPAMNAAKRGDRIARGILSEAAESLVADATACAMKLLPDRSPVQFIFNGAVLLKNPAFAREVTRLIQKAWPTAKITPLHRPSVWGAVELARRAGSASAPSLRKTSVPAKPASQPSLPLAITDLSQLRRSPTEQRNPHSMKFATLPVEKGIALMLREESGIAAAIAKEAAGIKSIVSRVVRAFETGGRLLYVGAGTSGRLGVLDASEIPPTFRASREQVQGIIAGGRQALWSAVEGAEDDLNGGAIAIANRGVDEKDVVLGIAASGRTPFVWGAIGEAKKRGAFTSFLCFNPAIKEAFRSPAQRHSPWRPDVILTPNTGPEVLTGSTRLKAGTATKVVLNIITTLAMTKVGKVISNLMVDVNPSNVKLRDRAVRIIDELTNCGPEEARATLKQCGWQVKEAHATLGRRKKKS
jgi:N-acetylmuramic acid 6-phosphate etherase